jgi:hypothetical protein
MEGSREEYLMALVTQLIMELIRFLERYLYEEDENESRSLDS